MRRHNLMMSMVIPGPNQPKNMESFFEPMIQELERLEKGITNVWDANRKEFFTLRVFTPLVAADQPARATEMRFGGASSIMFCSMCTQVGLSYGTKSYFPHVPPINIPPTKLSQMENISLKGKVVFDMSHPPFARFPFRDDKETRRTAKRIKLMRNGAAKDLLKYNTGIKGVSQWARLKAIDMKKSFNVCSMHLLYENVMPKLTRQYRGVFKYGTNPLPDNDSSQKESKKKIDEILSRCKTFNLAPPVVPAVSRLRSSEARKPKNREAPPITSTTPCSPVHPSRFTNSGAQDGNDLAVEGSTGIHGHMVSASTPTRSLSSFSKESSVIYLRREGLESAAENGTEIEGSDQMSTRLNTSEESKVKTTRRKRSAVMWMSKPRSSDETGSSANDSCSDTDKPRPRLPGDRQTLKGGGRTCKRGNHDTKPGGTGGLSKKRKRMDDQDTRDLIEGLDLPDAIKNVLFDGVGKSHGKDNDDASSGVCDYSQEEGMDRRTNGVYSKPVLEEVPVPDVTEEQDTDDHAASPSDKQGFTRGEEDPMSNIGTPEESDYARDLFEGFRSVHSDMDSSDESTHKEEPVIGTYGSRKRRAPTRYTPCEPDSKKPRSSMKSLLFQEPQPKKTRRRRKKGPNSKDTGAIDNKKEKSTKDKLPKFNYVPEDGYNVPPDDWKDIGKDSVASNATFPAQFGDNMKDFTTHCHRLKAANWSRWAYSESLVHLFDRLKEPHYGEYVNLIRAMMLSVQYELTTDEIAEIRRRMDRFVMYYEANMYRFDYYRIQACLSVIHYLRHIADCIEWAGPLFVYWQYCTERLCGMITSAIRCVPWIRLSMGCC